MEIVAALVGAVIGMFVGLTSIGGGTLVTPALVLLLGLPPSVAVGSAVFNASVMKVFGAGAYALRGEVHWGTVIRLACGSIPGALAGIALLNRLPAGTVDSFVGRGLGVALVLAGLIAVRQLLKGERTAEGPMPAAAVTVLMGFGVGVLVSMTSVGAGSLLMAVLTRFFPLRARTLVGTDIVHAVLLTSVAGAGHLMSGRVDVGLTAALLVGTIPGILIGARLALVVPDRALRVGLAVVLTVVGVNLVAKEPRAQVPVVAATVIEEPGVSEKKVEESR